MFSFVIYSIFLFFCSASASDCPSGWVDAADSCYLLVNSEKMNWIEAQLYCQSIGGHLAETLTEDWSNLLTSIAGIESEVLGVEYWWLGLSDLGHEGRWVWQNAIEEAEYTNWAEGFPSNGDVERNCVAMSAENDLKWSDYACNDLEASPICQTDTVQETSTPVFTSPQSSSFSQLDIVKLVGGDGYSSGNIFVQNNEGYFGPVCDDRILSNTADVVCRQLGFDPDRPGQLYTASRFGDVEGTFAMDDVVCQGTEDRIQDCRYTTLENCGPGEAAGVQCFGNKTFI